MRLYKRAEEVFENESQARQWFNRHPKSLGDKTPLGFAETEPGAREVEALLERIEHGVFS
jgi:putative toxin-antitoxin system antitoxin component (TIGR02293 family)